MSGVDDSTELPVTVLVSRLVKPGRETAFLEWAAGAARAASGFPGHRGAQVIRTEGGHGQQFLLLFSFASQPDLAVWERSDVRRRWLEQAADLVEQVPHLQKLTGLETWFSLPDAPGPPAPPRYKMMAVTELAIFPLLAVLTFLLGPLLTSFPTLLRQLVTSAVMVAMMTYLVMPLVTRAFRRWLYC